MVQEPPHLTGGRGWSSVMEQQACGCPVQTVSGLGCFLPCPAHRLLDYIEEDVLDSATHPFPRNQPLLSVHPRIQQAFLLGALKQSPSVPRKTKAGPQSTWQWQCFPFSETPGFSFLCRNGQQAMHNLPLRSQYLLHLRGDTGSRWFPGSFPSLQCLLINHLQLAGYPVLPHRGDAEMSHDPGSGATRIVGCQ